MSEQIESAAPTTAPATPAPSGPPPEVLAEINARLDELKTMSKEQLIELAKTHGHDFNPELVNEDWLRRKLSYNEQNAILKKHGVVETPKVAKRRAAVDAAEKTEGATPDKKPGRKRMNKSGAWKLALGDPPNLGRTGSVRYGIIQGLLEKESFTIEEFDEAVVAAMKYDASTEAFGVNTRFATIKLAQNAWWSELVNKAKVIVAVTVV